MRGQEVDGGWWKMDGYDEAYCLAAVKDSRPEFLTVHRLR